MERIIRYLILFFSLLLCLPSFSFVSLNQENILNTDSLFFEYKKESNNNTKFEILNQLIISFYYQADYVNSIKYANQYLVLRKTENISEDQGKSQVHYYLGKSYYEMNMLSKSLDYLTKSLIEYQKGKDISKIASVYRNIGNLYLRMNKTELANNNYNKSLEYAKKANDNLLMSLIYNNIGNLSTTINNHESAIDYYKKSIVLQEKINKNNFYAPYMNIAMSYANLNKLDSAKRYLKISENYIGKSIFNRVYFLYNYASVRVLENDFDNAEKRLQEALEISIEKNYNYITINCYKLLSDIYKKQENYQFAFNYQFKYANYNDSISKLDEQVSISQMELLFKNEKNLTEIEKLNKEKEIDKFKILVLYLIIVLVVIFLIYVFIQKRNIKRANVIIVKDFIELKKLRSDTIELRDDIMLIAETTNSKTLQDKYNLSPLSDNQKTDIATKITDAFESRRLFIKKDFNLNTLVNELGVNRSYISQVLSEDMNTNFSELTNQYRIEYAKELLTDDKYSNYTIFAIAEMAGFSYPSFNRVFKKITGVTPSFFKKIYKRESS